jgi:alpha-D-ribose 1-methylphosphonate 5-triphosphate synthase subunit PhnI
VTFQSSLDAIRRVKADKAANETGAPRDGAVKQAELEKAMP